MKRTSFGACCVWASVMLAPAMQAAAQQPPAPPVQPAPSAQAAQTPPPPLITTLEEVRALPPDEEALDLYRFDNPIKVEPNRFSDSYHPPPSPKEISENGGYLVYGFGKLVGAVANGLQEIPGIKGQIQPASARAPPLSLEQMDRAARIGTDDTAIDTGATQAPPPHE